VDGWAISRAEHDDSILNEGVNKIIIICKEIRMDWIFFIQFKSAKSGPYFTILKELKGFIFFNYLKSIE
jgi:hypothetical protein